MKNNNSFLGPVYGTLTLLILVISTLVCSLPIFLLGILKLIPNTKWRVFCTRVVDYVATCWIEGNNLFLKVFYPTKIEVTGTYPFNKKQWHLVVANHQSWLDIVILQKLLNKKIPVLKFFIKDQLKWVPLLGFAWWAMGCPFMKRYSKSYLEKKPHKKNKDLQATQKALRLLKESPTTIMSFIEGTRYKQEKSKQQQSPYKHLLKPKAGGVGFVIEALSQKISCLLDVTIVYPDINHSLWDFLCHRISHIKINIKELPVPTAFLNESFLNNESTIVEFRQWLNEQWAEKDRLIDEMVNSIPPKNGQSQIS